VHAKVRQHAVGIELEKEAHGTRLVPALPGDPSSDALAENAGRSPQKDAEE
jgi:hypothetical protein